MTDAALAGACNCSSFAASSLKNRRTLPISFRKLSCQPQPLSFQKSVSRSLQAIPSQSLSRQWQSSVQVNAAVGYPASMTWWKKGNQPNMREIHSAEDFVDALTEAGDKLVLVDFFSIGCRSCKAIHPKICQLAAENPDIEVLKVNFYENDILCRSLNVNILPFFHFYGGAEGRLDAFSCSLSKVEKLRKTVAKLKSDRVQIISPSSSAKQTKHLALSTRTLCSNWLFALNHDNCSL